MRQLLTFGVTCVLLLAASNTWAASTSFFEKGLLHPLGAPSHILAVVSLAMLLGQQGWRHIRSAVPVFAISVITALILTRFLTVKIDVELTLLPVAMIIGLLLTLKREWPLVLSLLLAVVIAGIAGYDSKVPFIPGLQVEKIHASLAGSGVSILGLLVIVTTLSWLLRNVLQGIALRVLGAWSATGAALVLTLLLANNNMT